VTLREQVPPPELSSRIGGAASEYDTIGAGHAAAIRSLLPRDWGWAGRRILDFGCGTGRTLVHLEADARDAELWGCDIDAPSIQWAQQNLSPPLNFVVNDELPPIHLPSASFDLAYGMSVFTHLVDTWSAWLLEMRRLLKPGGYGIFSFLGEGMFRALTGREWDADRVGMLGLDVGRPWAIGGPNALHSEWWLREHWGRAFEIVDVKPYWDESSRSGHGLVVVRRDERDDPTTEELERIDATDPREVESLRLNLELSNERSAALWTDFWATTTTRSWKAAARLRRVRDKVLRR
jgi:SAM-dependent methyltransferase